MLVLAAAAICMSAVACTNSKESISSSDLHGAGTADPQPSDAGLSDGADDTAALKGQISYSKEELIRNDMILYAVDCAAAVGAYANGADAPQTVGEDGKFTSLPGRGSMAGRGFCQSVTDREFGKDEATGFGWGYVSRDDIIAELANDGATSWQVNPDAEYDAGSTGIYYSFEVPDGRYEITCGFYSPFSTRRIDILAEGETLVSQEKIYKFKTVGYTCEQTVTDGVLDIEVTNLERGRDRMQNPMLSYIEIRMVPEYDLDWLELILASTLPDEEEKQLYTESSLMRYLEIREKAETIMNDRNSDKDAVNAACAELKSAFTGLEPKVIYASFRPGTVWRDTENTPIQAHGGQVQRLKVKDRATGEEKEVWWWVGEDKTNGYRGGINAYSSEDLMNWTFEGTVMRNVNSRAQLDTEDYFRQLYAGYTAEQLDNVYMCINDTTSVIERPKMIFNEKTGMYIMWFHADGPTATSNSNYAAASAGVAVSDSPYGPFRFIDRYRLNVCPDDQKDFHPSSRGMARDMNLFIDDDGTAYIIYASEENLTLYLSKLNDEFTGLATPADRAVYGEDFIRIFPGAQREGPALFKRNGKYYLMTSACTGWDPNQASYAMADSLFGEWVNMGDPCVDDTEHTTFRSQSTCIFCADEESNFYIYMGDRWNSDELNDSRYIWLPINFDENGRMSISFVDEWSLD